jgi:hypothetical protein
MSIIVKRSNLPYKSWGKNFKSQLNLYKDHYSSFQSHSNISTQWRSGTPSTSAQWDNSFVRSSEANFKFWGGDWFLGCSGKKPTLSANTAPLRRTKGVASNAVPFAFSTSWNGYVNKTTIMEKMGILTWLHELKQCLLMQHWSWKIKQSSYCDFKIEQGNDEFGEFFQLKKRPSSQELVLPTAEKQHIVYHKIWPEDPEMSRTT